MPKLKQKFYGAFVSAESPVYRELEGTVEEINGELYGFSQSAISDKWIVTHIPTGMRPFKNQSAEFFGFATQKSAKEYLNEHKNEIADALSTVRMINARKNLAKYVASVERGNR